MNSPRALALALIFALPACIVPSVLDEKQRSIEVAAEELAWLPARSEDLRGLFESVSIEGEAAAALWKIYYHFAPDGTFTAAALIVGGAQPQFQTLSGTWNISEQGLDLGTGEPVRALFAADRLRFELAGGVAILRRVAAH